MVWFDAFVMNVDRTPRNINMLYWHRKLWLIDHGAALTFQHQWDAALERRATPFASIKDHVLLPFASDLQAADAASTALLSEPVISAIVQLIPDAWLADRAAFATPADEREAYRNFLLARLAVSNVFTQEAQRARSLRV